MEMRARNTSADVSRCILWQGSAHRPAELVGDHVWQKTPQALPG
jgi:hypothetical protein